MLQRRTPLLQVECGSWRRNVGPRRACAQQPEDAVQGLPVIHTLLAVNVRGSSGSFTAHSASIKSNCAVGILLLGVLRALRVNSVSQYGFATWAAKL